GPDDRSLFGWYHAPAGKTADIVAVICQPLGHEYINAHRSMRHLADRLARAGIPALRFDYHGTGDSTGSDDDPGRVSAWRESVAQAVATARALSGRTRIALVGFRFGATLAAAASAELDIDSLVLWAPVTRGRMYARELKALHLTSGNESGSLIEPGGFLFTEETLRDIGALEPVPKAARVLELWQTPVQRDAGGYNEMLASPHNTAVPYAAIDEIVEWLGTGATLEEPVMKEIRLEQRDGGVRETPIELGHMVGILSEPADGKVNAVPAVLLPNAGSVHHVGPSRLYVTLARALSSRGFRVLRFDLPGLGDSVIDDAPQENHPYIPPATPSLESVRAALRQQSYVVTGLCSGAHAAFHAARELNDVPLVESVLINPLTFYFEPGMSLDTGPANTHYSEWQRYLQLVRSGASWRKILRGDFGPVGVLRTIAARIGFGVARGRRSDQLAVDLRRIVESGRKLTFLFSRLDAGYDLLMAGAGPAVKRLQKNGQIDLGRIDGANHTFEAKRSRDEMIARLVGHLAARYGARG
ncbi:MAG TPA: alpha/beta fold hydrolase, partial [Thermoanaerobaculia bacterium]|nr:alpha/beta fold hydrolase [Thermoanaerobaculia bacterium]